LSSNLFSKEGDVEANGDAYDENRECDVDE
jgi:hypothetical protein